MEMIGLDFIGPLPSTEAGNKHVLVVVDYFTKWVEAFPLPDQKAETVARTLMRDVASRYGVPVVIHSDKGANFEGNVMKQLCQLLGMKKTRTTAYHPQSDGLVERMNKTLMEAISKYVSNNQRDWDLVASCIVWLSNFETCVHWRDTAPTHVWQKGTPTYRCGATESPSTTSTND